MFTFKLTFTGLPVTTDFKLGLVLADSRHDVEILTFDLIWPESWLGFVFIDLKFDSDFSADLKLDLCFTLTFLVRNGHFVIELRLELVSFRLKLDSDFSTDLNLGLDDVTWTFLDQREAWVGLVWLLFDFTWTGFKTLWQQLPIYCKLKWGCVFMVVWCREGNGFKMFYLNH